MDLITEIHRKLTNGEFEFTRHAVDRMLLRHISVKEVKDAVQNGVVIEDYPYDKYGPSCLILGLTKTNRPLHIQCSYPARHRIKIITVYEPDPASWQDNWSRRI
ncbi:MAG: DUF4258 domain-containing protein [Caldilineales bacterium]|nr:DUF4258 domain-containing protein [Caldilineales bacterium]